MNYRQRIEQKLSSAFSPSDLLVRDDSAEHAGHAGARPEGETHFYVEMRSAAFAGKSRIERQRMVYHALKDEMEERIHALALKLSE